MPENDAITITASQLKAYLYSFESYREKEKQEKIQNYINENGKTKKNKLKKITEKIEKELDKEYTERIEAKNNILELLKEMENLPKDIEKLKIAEYMIYRVDLRRAEKKANKIARQLEKQFDIMKEQIEEELDAFPQLDDVGEIDYKEYDTEGKELKQTKEKYKLEYTEEQRNKLIERELEIISKLKEFNSVPMPHEILKNSDRDIQSKMQKFTNQRQKRIRILSSMEEDYKKTLDSKEINTMIDDAIEYLSSIQEILTEDEYESIKKMLIKRRKRIFRSTKELRSIIATKEKKTGVLNFNIQKARYERMEKLRQDILDATSVIKHYPVEQTEEQLEKLKNSYAKEKQFVSVMQKLNTENGNNDLIELTTFENRIMEMEKSVLTSKQIVSEQQEKIKNAKKELIILWKIEINEIISKKQNSPEISAPVEQEKSTKENIEINMIKRIFKKLKRNPSGKHACT